MLNILFSNFTVMFLDFATIYSSNLVIRGIIGRTVIVATVLQFCWLIRSTNMSTKLGESAIDTQIMIRKDTWGTPM
jgi:hypothetical protein